ncbi:hypothetical protein F1880_005686 [Penicillium rolfsii]|nr:hypothetical protein F1880_005686 [Penicillium rolfsii]
MNPQNFIRDRQTFRERLLKLANKLSAGSIDDRTRMEIVAELEVMVKEIEVIGTPPPLGKVLARNFDLVDSGAGDEDNDSFESYVLTDALAEADFGRFCSKDGAIRDTLSWASELLSRRQAPLPDIGVILDMLALHIGRLRLTPVSEGVVVDLYADNMDNLARLRHESNQNYENKYLRAIWNRLYDCMDCHCDKCSGIRR